MVQNDNFSLRFYEKLTLRDFLPILTLALGYFYGVSYTTRETISRQNTNQYITAPLPAVPVELTEESEGPTDAMPMITKSTGTFKLKGWDRTIPEAYERLEDLYEEEVCECSWGGKYNFNGVSNQTHVPIHKKDMELWKRDNFFDQNKPPPTFAKSHLPVSYITSGYEIDPTESVKLQIFVAGDPDKYVTANFSCNFGEISWPEKGKTTVGRVNDALEVFALYTPTKYDARNDSNLFYFALIFFF